MSQSLIFFSTVSIQFFAFLILGAIIVNLPAALNKIEEELNPNSLQDLTGCKVEPGLSSAKPQDRFQFERIGYFCLDDDSKEGKLIFNRTVTLRDTWAKIEKS